MRCLSLHQPWASLLVHGAKRVETRSWPTGHRGPLLVHAAGHWSGELAALCREWPFADHLRRLGPADDAWDPRSRLPFGAIVGRVEVADCRPTESVLREWSVYEDGAAERYAEEVRFGDYSPGRFAWVCANPVAFPEPVPFRGRPRLFDVPAEVLRPAGVEQCG